jgi:hypothetical protein
VNSIAMLEFQYASIMLHPLHIFPASNWVDLLNFCVRKIHFGVCGLEFL